MSFHNTVKSYSILENLKLHMTIPYYEQIYPDAFTFNETTGIITVNSTSAKPGYLLETLESLTVGDIIEVTGEFRCLSGTLPKVDFDEYNSATTYQSMEYVQIKKNGEWETLKARYIFRDLKGHKKLRCVIGLWTADSGEYEMRNVRILVKSKRNIEDEKKQTLSPPLEQKPFVIRKNNGSWEIREDFAHGEALLEVVSTVTLQLKFSKQFRNRPVGVLGLDFYMNSYKYDVRIGDLQKDRAKIQFYDKEKNELQQLSAIPNDTHFSVLLIG